MSHHLIFEGPELAGKSWPMSRIYDKHFFQNTLRLEGPSAKSAIRIIIRHLTPYSVVDIGCGIGIYLKEFQKEGIEILGFDGAPEAIKNSLVGNLIKLHDLRRPLRLKRKFDLCLCVEVAEHLPKNCEISLIESLTGLSDTIVFTAATPGQGPASIGHINEQPHHYWKKRFKKRGFKYKKTTTQLMRNEMKSAGVVWWVTKNLMIFKK
ncbi:MAG: methyltransferase domain-containing protein [Patescibacteria group bacterium]|jgi:SAM-dependent methyltransferase